MPSGFSEDFTGKHGRPAAAPVNTLVTSPEGQSCFLSGACQGPLHFFKFVRHDLVGCITDSLTAIHCFLSFFEQIMQNVGTRLGPVSRELDRVGKHMGGCVLLGKPLEDVGPARVAGIEGETFHVRVLEKAEAFCGLVKKCHSSALGDVNCASWESRAGQTLAGSHLCKGTPRTPFMAWSPPRRGPENLGVSGSALLTMKPLQTAV